MMPILPFLLGRMNLRLMVILGLLCFAASCFLDIHLTADSSGGDFVASQLLRGVGQMLSMMPLNQASVGAVSREDAADAAGLFNMSRNLGGSLGLALLGVFIDRRAADHFASISSTVTANSQLAQERIARQAAALSDGGDAAYGQMRALASLSRTIQQQAMVITYSEAFWALGVLLLLMLPLVFLLRTPPRNAPPRAEAH
jgi:DHA2 family multidrug resistance protein